MADPLSVCDEFQSFLDLTEIFQLDIGVSASLTVFRGVTTIAASKRHVAQQRKPFRQST